MVPTVTFLPVGSLPDESLTFVVIAARCGGRHVFCRHCQRSTWECPGGHIEPDETPLQAAHRELYEETGCCAGLMQPVCIYSVQFEGKSATYGMLYRADIRQTGALPPNSEMACMQLFDEPPALWTYPDIQPLLLRRAWND